MGLSKYFYFTGTQGSNCNDAKGNLSFLSSERKKTAVVQPEELVKIGY